MGATACYCTQLALLDHWDELAGKVNIFPIMEGGRPLTQSLSLLRHRQRYLTHFSKSLWSCSLTPPPHWNRSPFSTWSGSPPRRSPYRDGCSGASGRAIWGIALFPILRYNRRIPKVWECDTDPGAAARPDERGRNLS